MEWRGTIGLAVLVAIVGAYLWFVDTPATPPTRPGTMQGPPQSKESADALRKLLVFDPTDVAGLQLQRASHRFTLERRDGNWQGTDDPSAVNDFLHTLATMGVLMDITVSAGGLAEYGLDPPLGVITLQLNGQAQPLVLEIGERNPAITGVYVRIGADGPVVLAGALVEWEFDKLFKRLSVAD